MTESDYKRMILHRTTEDELEEWLRRNPVPKKWNHGKYAYAYCEMQVGKVFTWWRKYILGYKI